MVINRQLEAYVAALSEAAKTSGVAMQSFGRAMRGYSIGNKLLPFEQWELKHRFNKGYTRPRGKKFKNAIDRYNNGYWVNGVWTRKPKSMVLSTPGQVSNFVTEKIKPGQVLFDEFHKLED